MACTEVICGTGTWTGPVPGDPDNNVSLRAVPAFGGIDVLWTYPATNPHAVAHTLLYRGTTNNRDAALPIAVVAGNSYYDKAEEELRYFYWIRIVSSNGTTGDWVGPASAVVKTRKQGTLGDLTAAIDSGVLATALRQDIDKITLNYSELLAEIQSRVSGDAALSAALAGLQDGVDQAVAFVQNEINTRIDGDTALAQQMGLIAAANAANASAIIDEKTARVTKDEALTTQYNALFAATGNTAAAVTAETIARTNADSALSSQITTAQSTLGNDISSVQIGLQTNINTVGNKVTEIGALYTAKVAVNGLVGGFGVYNNGTFVEAGFDVDRFWIGRTGQDKVKPFIIDGGTVYIDKARIRSADIDTLKVGNGAVTTTNYNQFNSPAPPYEARYAANTQSYITEVWVDMGQSILSESGVVVTASARLVPNSNASAYLRIIRMRDGLTLGFAEGSLQGGWTGGISVAGYDANPVAGGNGYKLIVESPSSGPGAGVAGVIKGGSIIATGGKR